MDMVRVRLASSVVWCGELNIHELVDVALGTNYAQVFVDQFIDLHQVDVDDVVPPIINLSDAKRHASLLSSFLSKNSIYFGVK